MFQSLVVVITTHDIAGFVGEDNDDKNEKRGCLTELNYNSGFKLVRVILEGPCRKTIDVPPIYRVPLSNAMHVHVQHTRYKDS